MLMQTYWRHARLLGMMLALAVLMVLPATAQNPSTTTTTVPRPLPARAQDQTIEISPSNTTLLTFDRPIHAIIVGDPDVADVTREGDRRVIVTAKKKPGATNLILLDADSNEMFNASIIVADLDPKGERITVQVGGLGPGNLQKQWVYRCPGHRLCEIVKEPELVVSHEPLATTSTTTSETQTERQGRGASTTSNTTSTVNPP